MDEWRQIDNSIYEVNMRGQVRNTKTGKILSSQRLRNGYPSVVIYQEKIPKDKLIHRAVLEAFRGRSDLHADHINRIKTDNRLENLRWVSPSQNNFNKDWTNAKVRSNSLSGIKNISVRDDYLVVKIIRNKKIVLRKRCPTVEEAIRVRDEFLNRERQIAGFKTE